MTAISSTSHPTRGVQSGHQLLCTDRGGVCGKQGKQVVQSPACIQERLRFFLQQRFTTGQPCFHGLHPCASSVFVVRELILHGSEHSTAGFQLRRL